MKTTQGQKERTVSGAMLDLKAVCEKMEALPYDRLMYVAGAVSALAAASKEPQPARPNA